MFSLPKHAQVSWFSLDVPQNIYKRSNTDSEITRSALGASFPGKTLSKFLEDLQSED